MSSSYERRALRERFFLSEVDAPSPFSSLFWRCGPTGVDCVARRDSESGVVPFGSLSLLQSSGRGRGERRGGARSVADLPPNFMGTQRDFVCSGGGRRGGSNSFAGASSPI